MLQIAHNRLSDSSVISLRACSCKHQNPLPSKTLLLSMQHGRSANPLCASKARESNGRSLVQRLRLTPIGGCQWTLGICDWGKMQNRLTLSADLASLGLYVPRVTIAQGSPAHTLFQSLSAYRQQWPGGGFSWDSRLMCVASSFSVDLENEARAAVTRVFRFQWNARTIRTSPELVQEIGEQVGGLRSDQILVATEPNEALMAYGLWWPWGDDVTISFRIGMSGLSSTRYEEDFRELFGVFAY